MQQKENIKICYIYLFNQILNMHQVGMSKCSLFSFSNELPMSDIHQLESFYISLSVLLNIFSLS